MSASPEDGDALGIVDTHQHFQDLETASYPWLEPGRPEPLEGDLAPIRRTYRPADYRRDVANLGIAKTVHVQNGRNPADPLEETRWLEGLAAREGGPDAIVGYADLADPKARALLEAHAACPRMRGIRQILNWHEDPRLASVARADLMSLGSWREGFAALAPLGLSFDLQIYWPQADEALRLARAFPETAIVLDHAVMMSGRSVAEVAGWRDAVKRLAAAENVAIKLSGLGLGDPRWSIETTLPLLRHAIDCFGPERTMVGTNLPVDRLFATPGRIVSALRAAVADLDAGERRAILSATAERFYRI